MMIDKLTTVRRSNVHTWVGRLTAEQLVEIEGALVIVTSTAPVGEICWGTAESEVVYC